MTGKEIIKRIINHDNPPRIGMSFSEPWPNDIQVVPGVCYRPESLPQQFREWGRYPELVSQVPWFDGEVRLDDYGNIYGRLNQMTKGECVKGALDDWSKLADYRLPVPDEEYYTELKKQLADCDKYVVAILPVSAFSTIRDLRLIDNALMDTALEPENLKTFLDMITELDCGICQSMAGIGVDAVMLYDDWGTQDRTLIGLESFTEIFLPVYEKICQTAHDNGMHVILHSCGKNHLFVEPLCEAGINVFQFDQPNAYPAGWLAENFGQKAAFFMPVDIQQVMPTGDKAFIESSARELVEVFRSHGSALIVKDYAPWSDICVEEEWAGWAKDVIVEMAKN